VRVVAKTLNELLQVLVQERVVGDLEHPGVQLVLGRQLPVEQQIRHLEEAGVLSELFDRIAAVLQDSDVAVDVGDRTPARRRIDEPWIVGRESRLVVQGNLLEVGGANRAVGDRDVVLLTRPVVANAEGIRHVDNLRWPTCPG
jgi:hypothetical protein